MTHEKIPSKKYLYGTKAIMFRWIWFSWAYKKFSTRSDQDLHPQAQGMQGVFPR